MNTKAIGDRRNDDRSYGIRPDVMLYTLADSKHLSNTVHSLNKLGTEERAHVNKSRALICTNVLFNAECGETYNDNKFMHIVSDTTRLKLHIAAETKNSQSRLFRFNNKPKYKAIFMPASQNMYIYKENVFVYST